jgi:hypothetical protein
VKVSPIKERNLHWRSLECLRRGKPAKTAAQN